MKSVCIWSLSGSYVPTFGQSISPYSVWRRKNTDQNKLQIRTLFKQHQIEQTMYEHEFSQKSKSCKYEPTGTSQWRLRPRFITRENSFHIHSITEVLLFDSIRNRNQEAVKWPIINASRSRIIIPVNTQVGVIKMAPTQINKVTNIADKSSCQGAEFTSRANKLNHGSEQAIELTNLQNENKMLKDQHDSQSMKTIYKIRKWSFKRIFNWPMTS